MGRECHASVQANSSLYCTGLTLRRRARRPEPNSYEPRAERDEFALTILQRANVKCIYDSDLDVHYRDSDVHSNVQVSGHDDTGAGMINDTPRSTHTSTSSATLSNAKASAVKRGGLLGAAVSPRICAATQAL